MIDFLRKKTFLAFCITFSIYMLVTIPVGAAGDTADIISDYQEYRQRFESIETRSQIKANGFQIIEEHVFPLDLEHHGEVTFMSALDSEYNRLAVFIVQKNGKILYKTEQLSANQQNQGELMQANKGISAVSFQDANSDGLTDILLVTYSESIEDGVSNIYKVGDVLFQQPIASQPAFYRDYRISDKLNQYGMNKSAEFIMSYMTRGYSTEFLYTADTLDELLANGFEIVTDQSFWREFEKWGRLYTVAGSYKMAEYSVMMLYLVNEQGYIVWSFQPMKDYEGLYALRGIVCKDINGDGLKDIVVLGRYLSEETDNEAVVISDYSVYYQRSEGFYEDTEVKAEYPCKDDDTVEDIVEKLRTYWGWN